LVVEGVVAVEVRAELLDTFFLGVFKGVGLRRIRKEVGLV